MGAKGGYGGGIRRGGGGHGVGGKLLHGTERGLRWSWILFHMHGCDGLGPHKFRFVYYEEEGVNMVQIQHVRVQEGGHTPLTIPFSEGGLNNA